MTLTVGDKATRYRLTALSPDPEVGSPAWAVQKLTEDGSVSEERYDIIRRDFGFTCDCADFEFRHRNTAEPCKHLVALMALGKVPWSFGAVDLAECPCPLKHGCNCGKCAVCGLSKHATPHLPKFGGQPGGEPAGHRFFPRVATVASGDSNGTE